MGRVGTQLNAVAPRWRSSDFVPVRPVSVQTAFEDPICRSNRPWSVLRDRLTRESSFETGQPPREQNDSAGGKQ